MSSRSAPATPASVASSVGNAPHTPQFVGSGIPDPFTISASGGSGGGKHKCNWGCWAVIILLLVAATGAVVYFVTKNKGGGGNTPSSASSGVAPYPRNVPPFPQGMQVVAPQGMQPGSDVQTLLDKRYQQ